MSNEPKHEPDPTADPFGIAYVVLESRDALARGERRILVADDIANDVANVFRQEGWAVKIDAEGGFPKVSLVFVRPKTERATAA